MTEILCTYRVFSGIRYRTNYDCNLNNIHTSFLLLEKSSTFYRQRVWRYFWCWWCCLVSSDQRSRRYLRRSLTSCLRCWSACRRTTVQLSSAATSTCMSTNRRTSTPCVWNNCCSRSTVDSTSLSRHTSTATLSTWSSHGHLWPTRRRHDIWSCSYPVYTVRQEIYSVNTQAVSSRAWRRLSLDAFTADLSTSPICSDLAALDNMSADDLVHQYRVAMTDLLDLHCPVVRVRRRARAMTPWFDADCRAARRRARAAERLYAPA